MAAWVGIDWWITKTVATTFWWHFAAVRSAAYIHLAVLLVLTVRLWIAYRKYLRFDHALATVVASQVMVALLLWKLSLDWYSMIALW